MQQVHCGNAGIFFSICANHPKTNTSTKVFDYAKAFDSVDDNKLWEILKELGIPDHLTYLLRSLYASLEVTELDMEQQTGSNWERSMSRLYITTLLI